MQKNKVTKRENASDLSKLSGNLAHSSKMPFKHPLATSFSSILSQWKETHGLAGPVC